MTEDPYRLLASYITQGARVCVLTGAGISAESGVPTFRGGGGAPIWRNYWDPTKLSHRDLLYKDLKLVWDWFDYRREIIKQCEPNPCHILLADIERMLGFEGFTLVTQNVDGLHVLAGSQNLIEMHGNMWRAKGLRCTHHQPLTESPLQEPIPQCAVCGGPLRPNVVLFGENLRTRDWNAASSAAETATVVLVIGTQAEVYPASELPALGKANGAFLAVVNPEPTGLSRIADLVFEEKAVPFAQSLSKYLDLP